MPVYAVSLKLQVKFLGKITLFEQKGIALSAPEFPSLRTYYRLKITLSGDFGLIFNLSKTLQKTMKPAENQSTL